MDQANVEARAALAKFAAVALVIALVVGLGTLLAVKALGLGGGPSSGRAAATSTATSSPRSLPTVAITPSGSASPSVTSTPTQEPTPTPTAGIVLAASPAQVSPGERINLTGTYTGITTGTTGPVLQVQRQSGGAWGPFGSGSGVSARVTGGSFATYVVTTRTGPSSFRLLDPATGTASNVVSVTVG